MNLSPLFIVSVLLNLAIILLSLSVHESAHAWMADRLGDGTARMLGRITLNPLPHIDPVGTVLLPLALAFFNMPVFGWAKPVPVTSRNFRNLRRDQALVAAAGPASNMALAMAGTILLAAVGIAMGHASFRSAFFTDNSAVKWIFQICRINLILAVFNMIPLPPLDGSWVLSSLLPGRAQGVSEALNRIGPFVLLFLFLSGALGYILGPLVGLIELFMIRLPLGLV